MFLFITMEEQWVKAVSAASVTNPQTTLSFGWDLNGYDSGTGRPASDNEQ
jgi:hypothetical protein